MPTLFLTLVLTIIGAIFGCAIGGIISGVLFHFIGWTWWPIIIGGVALGLLGGIQAYVYATTPWRG
jgi:hypothetical protein